MNVALPLPAEPRAPIGPDDPARFINRELSWLAFNERVLEEAANPATRCSSGCASSPSPPPTSTSSTSVRVAGLVGQEREGVTRLSPDGMTVQQQLAAIHARAQKLIAAQQAAWRALRGPLAEAGIVLVEPETLSEEDRAHLDTLFMERVFPVVTPLAVDPAHLLPLHSQHGAVHGAEAGAGGRRRHDACAAADPAAARSLLCACPRQVALSASCCWRI